MREASYAVGKTKIATIRRVLLPAARPSVITGHMLGIGHVIGDTAIILLLLGDTQTFQGVGHVPLLGILRGTGSTLTSYIFDNAPTGSLDQPNKAYAAAFVLLLIVLALNLVVDVFGRRSKDLRMELNRPPRVRRLSSADTVTARPPRSEAPTVVNGNGAAPTNGAGAASSFVGAGRPARATVPTIDRMNVDQVSIAYGSKLAVKSVSLPIRQGEVLALIGPSGCGKTTLLRSLNRLTELTKSASLTGEITLDGTDITTFEPTALRRRVTMVFQQPNPFPMSVFDNVAYVLRDQAKRRPRRESLRPAVETALARAGLLDEVADNLDHPALRLSGGQQQRLCIARALAAQPEVLLLDEPCSALDPRSTAVIEDLIVKLREQVAVVIVTHNLQQAYRIADHVGFMYLGELVEYATAKALFGSPRQQRTKDYVGGAFG